MLQLFTCEILHLFLLIKKKNLSSYRPPVFYRGRRLIVGIGCGSKTFVLCQIQNQPYILIYDNNSSFLMGSVVDFKLSKCVQIIVISEF